GNYANGILESGEIDYSTIFCSRFNVVELKDIRAGSGLLPDKLAAVGNILFFRADDGNTGQELWNGRKDQLPPLPNLPTGTYIMQCQWANGQNSSKRFGVLPE
ncbi:MAG: hypothetical protein ACPHGZ_02215, partial [Schleiferiaceae bacterium]